MPVTLHNLTRDHLDDFFTWASDPDVAKSMTWEAYENKEEALDFLTRVAKEHPCFKAICFHGKIVGSITLMPTKKIAELGYVLAKKYWGRGIATEAVKIALESGFTELGMSRIEAFVDPNNLASQRVLEKNGMKREGLLKNSLLFKGKLADRYLYSKSSCPENLIKLK